MQKKADLTNNPLTDEMTRKFPYSNLRVIQIHPSLKCNLYCKHCYSASGPESNTFLDLADVLSFLEYARTYGFNVLSLSGGEPFLYPRLEELLISSHSLGNRNMAATNGMLFKSDKAKRILNHLDLIAISIDGEPCFHDEVRNLPGAFSKMVEGVDIVSKKGMSFGFIHTITEQSWQKLFWLSEFAYSKGAALLQLHPLELTGRALTNFSHLIPSQESLHKVFIIGSYLEEKYAGKMKIQLDFLHRAFILQSPQVISFFAPAFEINKSNFSDVVKSLIVDEKGNIYPMSYGFAGHFCIGNINEIKNGRDVIGCFIEEKGKDLYKLITDVFSSIQNETTNDLITWTEMIVRKSHSFKSLSLPSVPVIQQSKN